MARRAERQIASSVISTDDSVFLSRLYATRFDYLLPRYRPLLPDFLECIDVFDWMEGFL